MGLRAVLNVDVNDPKFAAFAAKFDQYQKLLSKTPAAWKAVGKENAAIAKQFEHGAAALLAQNDLIHEQMAEDKKRLSNLTLEEKLWQSIGKSSKTYAENIASVGKNLLKWGSIIGAGLLGGSLFGIDRLASKTSDERSSAAGLGLSIGEQKAFNLDMGQFFGGNANGFLSGVADTAADISKQSAFLGIGVVPRPNESTFDLAVDTLKALRQKTRGMPVEQLGIFRDSFQVGQLGASVEDLRRIQSATPKEFEEQMAALRHDKVGLNIDDSTAQAWKNLDNQFNRAGTQIERAFITGLTPLIPSLKDLSASLSKFIETLLKSDDVGNAIKSLSGWLTQFSGQLGSPEFQANVSSFMSDMGDLATTLHNVLHPIDALRNNSAATAGYKEYLDRVDAKYHLPVGLSRRVFQTESGSRMYGVPVSSAGALGPMQLMPGTAAQYHVDPTSPYPAGDAEGHYLSDLQRHYQGDLIKALAAYNWGEGNLDKYLAKDKDPDWIRGLPSSVKSYLGQTAVHIDINNNTGGNTIVMASALTLQ